jgi:hypothetical protein
VKDRGWVIDFVFWSMIDSWEMESLPTLIVLDVLAGVMPVWCGGRR